MSHLRNIVLASWELLGVPGHSGNEQLRKRGRLYHKPRHERAVAKFVHHGRSIGRVDKISPPDDLAQSLGPVIFVLKVLQGRVETCIQNGDPYRLRDGMSAPPIIDLGANGLELVHPAPRTACRTAVEGNVVIGVCWPCWR